MKEPVNCSPSELSIYLQALEAGYLAESSLDGKPSALSRLIHIASKSLQLGKKTVSFPGFQFLMIFENLMEHPGEDSLTSSPEGFPVKTSQQLENEKASTGNGQDSGQKWPGSFAKFDPATSSWKTHQCSLLGDYAAFSETYPRWGLMRDGELLEQTPLVLPTNANDCGLLPTPTVNPSHRKLTDGQSIAKNGERWGISLFQKLGGNPHPQFVEWMMGWPLEWTALEPLATDKFRQWYEQHGIC